MKKIELVIFDMDGLILDTEKLYLEFSLEAFRDFGHNITEEAILGTVGLNDESTKAYYVEYLGKPVNIIEEVFGEVEKKLLSASINKEIEIKNGFFELADYLEKSNIKKVVATSSSREKAEYLLKNAGIFDRFDFLVCGDEVLNGKPDPEIFLKAAEKLKADVKNTMVLEDSYNGLRAAKSADMIPVMIPDLLKANEEITRIIYKETKNLEGVVKILESYEN
ncbi:MAG: HAD family phosphatase [Fusobacteriales bacterium]|jgi:HAD superfamily hydrolase (TIGR01509 family)|nr:HAD family phosphatase [Fusobacteriales bacterium]